MDRNLYLNQPLCTNSSNQSINIMGSTTTTTSSSSTTTPLISAKAKWGIDKINKGEINVDLNSKYVEIIILFIV
jgi:hypothetical protein